MITIDGLVSGLDTASIVEGALALQQSRVDRLNLQRQEVTEQQTAFKSIEGQLIGLRGSMSRLLRSANSSFDAMQTVVSDEEAIEVSASSSAAPGTYVVRVNQLAQAHQLKSDGLTRDSDLVGTGTLTIQVGNRAESEIVVDSGTTLDGLADLINSQSDDVLASVVDDGSDTTPVRLLLTSRHSGEANDITITGDLDLGGGDTFGFDTDSVQEGRDAQIQIGSGVGAIVISSESNQFDNMLPGLSIDALSADPTKEITINVSQDTSSIVEAVQTFVDGYNGVIGFINENSQFDPDTETGGIFLGDRTAVSVVSTLQSAVGSVLADESAKFKTLSSIGISFTDSGTLTLNRSTLEDILEGRTQDAGIRDVQKLFAIVGESDTAGVEYILGTNDTQASPPGAPYQVEISRAASAASLTASAPSLATTVINNANNEFKIKIDSADLTVTIPEGSYSRQELADQIETLINTSEDRAGRSVEVSLDDSDHLVIRSESFGSDSALQILDGSANAPLGLTQGQAGNGNDVTGKFLVDTGEGNLLEEEATGNGQILRGSSSNEYTADLQIRSTLSPSQVTSPVTANMTVTRGIGAALDAAIDGLLEATNGQLSSIQTRFTSEIEDIDRNIDAAEERIEARRASLLAEFAALETTLSELQSSGDALTSSLLSLQG